MAAEEAPEPSDAGLNLSLRQRRLDLDERDVPVRRDDRHDRGGLAFHGPGATIAAQRLRARRSLFALTPAPAADAGRAHTEAVSGLPMAGTRRHRPKNPNPQIDRESLRHICRPPPGRQSESASNAFGNPSRFNQFEIRSSGNDQRLVEFSRPYGPQVKPRRVAPAATGYLNRLYEIERLSPDRAQLIEVLFMRSVDTQANEALDLIEARDSAIDRSAKYRSAWSRFLMSLMMRMPNDLKALKAAVEAAAEFAAETDCDVAEALRIARAGVADRGTLNQMAMVLLPQLVNHENLGQKLNEMRWFTVETAPGTPELFTSDQPVIVGRPLQHPEGFICLPIGPNRIFWAITNHARESEIRSGEAAVRQINEIVVSRAHQRSYSTSDAPLAFMQEWLAKEPHVSWFKSMADEWATDRTSKASEEVE